MIDSNGDSGKTISHALRPKGHNIYRGPAELEQGDTVFIVGFNRWRQQVAATNENYEVIYDGSDPKNPRLLYFLK